LTIDGLYKMTSQERRDIFAKSLGEETAQEANALFETAMLSSQKNALKNWIWKNLYHGVPLYVDLNLVQSENIRNGVSMSELRGMTPEQRIAELEKYVDKDTAIKLEKRYAKLKLTGNLSNWEQRVMGTDELMRNKKLKGAFARVEALNELGVLSPKDMSTFMEDFVSMQVGATVTAEESEELSKLVTNVSAAFDKANTDWTANNRENVVDYFVEHKKLEDFVNKLDPEPALKVFTDVGARGAILFSLRTLTNSLMFQIVPGVTRLVTKRIGSGTMIPGDYSFLDRVFNSFSSVASKPLTMAMAEQVAMGLEIYIKTSHDIARMETLGDGFKFFGEGFTHVNGPTWKEAESIAAKLGTIVRGHGRWMQPALKYAAGGTDAVFANAHRADTTNFLANTIANGEKKTGNLPAGLSVDDRIQFLIKDAYSFSPTTEQGRYIRESAIQDAHHANFTNNDIYGDVAMKFRDALGIGNAKIGTLLLPFMRIPANALGKGFEMTGPGLIRGTKQIIDGVRMESGVDKNLKIAEGIATLVTSGGGLVLAAVFVSALLDDDDYIGAYDYTRRSENQLTTTKNAAANYVRIGGNWYSTRWFGPLGLPISAMMEARQARAKNQNIALGYAKGILTGALQFPGLKEGIEWAKSIEQASRASEVEGAAKAFHTTPEYIGKWAAVRTIPSILTYDTYGLLNKTKYDSLGRPIPNRTDDMWSTVTTYFVGANIKDDTSNYITKEFDKLSVKGALPTLTNPDGKYADALQVKIGAQAFEDFVNKLKAKYADEVGKLISKEEYKKKTPLEQKKAIDKIRDQEILNPIETQAKKTPGK